MQAAIQKQIEWLKWRRVHAAIGFCILLAAVNLPYPSSAQTDSTLRDRRFDQVAFLYTHNAYNVRGHHRLPNQNLTVAQQLDLGVRGLMLDVYAHHDRVMLYHANRLLGHRPLEEDLVAIKAFLDAHPTEVLSIIFESSITPEQLARALTQAGLLSYACPQPIYAPWPTLAQMIAANQRLVIFSEKDRGNPYPWLLHVWDYATENRYSNHSRADFDTRYNRGDSTRRLFLLNHFITHRKFGFGLPDSALVANSLGCILDHALEAWAHTGHFPNFVAVDFVEKGNAGEAVQMLNALWEPSTTLQAPLIDQVQVSKADGEVTLRFLQPTEAPFSVTLRDVMTGLVLTQDNQSRLGLTELLLLGGPTLPDGTYSIELRMGTHFERRRLELKR